jgi:phage/plasmid-associated DNA primase
MDLIRQWIDEKCETGPTSSDTSANLYKSWFSWAENAGEKPGTARWFSQALLRLGFRKLPSTSRRGFYGIEVKKEPVYNDWSDE